MSDTKSRTSTASKATGRGTGSKSKKVSPHLRGLIRSVKRAKERERAGESDFLKEAEKVTV